MSWRAVAAIYGVLAVLLAVVLLGEQPPEPTAPAPEAAPERSLLGMDAAAVRAVEFRRGDVRVRAVRDDDRWRMLDPEGARVPSDLVAAAVATLTAGQVSEVVAERPQAADLATFGLAEPHSAIVITAGTDDARRELTVLLGERNPTRTALYARRTDDPRVYLVGLNLRYYEDLIFDAVSAAAS